MKTTILFLIFVLMIPSALALEINEITPILLGYDTASTMTPTSSYQLTFQDNIMKFIHVHVTSDEIKQLNANPKVLIVDDENKTISIMRAIYYFNYDGLAYTGTTTGCNIEEQISGNRLVSSAPSGTKIRGTASFIQEDDITSSAQVRNKNNTAVLKCNGGEFATGNGTLDIYMNYYMSPFDETAYLFNISYNETDPIYSAVADELIENATNGSIAYGWGNHNTQGYFDNIANFTGTLTDTKFCTYDGSGTINCTSNAGADSEKVNIINDVTTASNYYPTWVKGNSGTQQVYTSSSKLYFSPYTGRLTASYIDALHQIVEDSATNQYFPVLFGNSVSSWSYLYGTPAMRYNPSLGELSAPYFSGDGSNLTNLPSSSADTHVIAKGYEWRDDSTYPPTWYDTGFAGTNIGYDEFYGATTSSNNQYIHFVLEVPDTYVKGSGDSTYVYVNFAFTDNYDTGRIAFKIDWSLACPQGGNFANDAGTIITKYNLDSSGRIWDDFITDLSLIESKTEIEAGCKYNMRLTRDIGDSDTMSDYDISVLLIGMRFMTKI